MPAIKKLLSIIFIACALTTYAQKHVDIIDSIAQQMGQYATARPSEELFVHYDKNIYTNFENVWFSAYLINTVGDINQYTTLSVCLVKNNDRTVWAENQFVMHNGLGSGSMFLPDSLPPGNFSFIAYTNRLTDSMPGEVFIQPVTIKTLDAAFTASLTMLDSATINSDAVRIRLKVYASDLTYIKDATLTYTYGQGNIHKAFTDKFGEYIISVPLKGISPGNNILHVEVKHDGLFKELSLPIPVYQQPAKVKFYPEGGNLADGTPMQVGWEAKTDKGEPLQASGFLYEGPRIIDTIITNADGMGRFTFTPNRQYNYSLRLAYQPSRDTLYMLPTIAPAMPVLSLSTAIANDTLNVLLRNTHAAKGQLYLIMHDFKTLFTAYSITDSLQLQHLNIPLTKVPKGLVTLTLLDGNIPLAERIFFAHYDKRVIAEISCDTTEYSTRKKVEATIKLTGKDTAGGDGIISVACVQNTRIDVTKMTDIESYTYLKYALANLPFTHNTFATSAPNNDHLENALLIKGWRRYNWPDMMAAQAGDTAVVQTSAALQGSISENNKAIKGQMSVGMYIDSSLAMITTDKRGRFQVPLSQLVLEPGKKAMFFLNNKYQGFYTMHINNPYSYINKKLAATLNFQNFDIGQGSVSSDSLVLKQSEHVNVLKTVIVKANREDPFAALRKPVFKGDCTDYVCEFFILNCPNHKFSPRNTRPVNDVLYLSPVDGAPIKYKGNCLDHNKNEYLLLVDGIYTNKEFYVEDLADPNNTVPQFLSTIYWNPSLHISSGKDAKINFYTSDITGKFRIVVQGRTDNDVVFGEYLFNVNKPGAAK